MRHWMVRNRKTLSMSHRPVFHVRFDLQFRRSPTPTGMHRKLLSNPHLLPRGPVVDTRWRTSAWPPFKPAGTPCRPTGTPCRPKGTPRKHSGKLTGTPFKARRTCGRTWASKSFSSMYLSFVLFSCTSASLCFINYLSTFVQSFWIPTWDPRRTHSWHAICLRNTTHSCYDASRNHRWPSEQDSLTRTTPRRGKRRSRDLRAVASEHWDKIRDLEIFIYLFM
jgi:hypothetical protein